MKFIVKLVYIQHPVLIPTVALSFQHIKQFKHKEGSTDACNIIEFDLGTGEKILLNFDTCWRVVQKYQRDISNGLTLGIIAYYIMVDLEFIIKLFPPNISYIVRKHTREQLIKCKYMPSWIDYCLKCSYPQSTSK